MKFNQYLSNKSLDKINYFVNILRKVKRYYLFSKSQKIVIGSANILVSGWLLTDKNTLDITKRDDFAQYWKPNSRTAFLAEHVW
jgi:hypothetical protein